MALGLGFAPGCSSDDDNNTDAGTGGTGARGGTGGGTGGTGGSTGGTGGSTGGTGGSTGGTGGSGGAAVTFADVQAILMKSSNSCPLCHTGGAAMLPASLNIKSHSDLLADSLECTGAMARKRVKPGDAANSYLVHKIKGIMLCPKVDGSGTSVKMPATGGAGVSAEDIVKIEAWINAGAPM
jgi:hypothetical protein